MPPLKRIILLFYFGSISMLGWTQDTPPEINAEGDQFYCPLSEINVVTDFDISGPPNLDIDAFYIQISSGYVSGDILKLDDNQNGLITSWDGITGKLTLTKSSGFLSYQEINEAVESVIYTGNDPEFVGEKNFSFTLGDANYLPSTGHFYEFIPNLNVSWTQARDLAEQRSYYGLPGYLATITSREEAILSGEQAQGTGWIGASDAAEEGTWKWVTGPEVGTQLETFWIGDANGYAPNGAFENWDAGEPNNLNDEDYGHVITNPAIGPRGSWNDLPVQGGGGDYAAQGYIVEYGYGGPDDAPGFSASSRVYTNGIESVVSGSLCGPGSVDLSATATVFENQPVPTEILWFTSLTSSSPIDTGNTYSTEYLTATTTFYVLASQGGCTIGARTPVVAEIYEIPDIEKEVTLKNCDADDNPNDGFTDFNLEEANDVISKGDSSLMISYFLSEENAIEGNEAIDPPYFNSSIADRVYARVENQQRCFDIALVHLEAYATAPLESVVLESCDLDETNDGKYAFNLTEATEKLLIQLPTQNVDIQYYRNLNDATLKQNEILPQTSYKNEEPEFQILSVRIESVDFGECMSLGEFVELYVYLLPEFDLVPEAYYCENFLDNEVSITNPKGDYTYEWYDSSGNIAGTGTTLSLQSAGTYSVIATSDLNCRSRTKTVVVRSSAKAQISQADIKVEDGENSNSILINTSNLGIGSYEYALDDGPYQDEPFFDDVLSGIRILYVQDKNGCGITSIEVAVIGFLKFFTPNGDGYHDKWQVDGIISQPGSNIYIYDKFGKLLAEIDPLGLGWDGNYNGKQMPSSDYWFRVQLTDGRIYTGHFSLIRRE